MFQVNKKKNYKTARISPLEALFLHTAWGTIAHPTLSTDCCPTNEGESGSYVNVDMAPHL